MVLRMRDRFVRRLSAAAFFLAACSAAHADPPLPGEAPRAQSTAPAPAPAAANAERVHFALTKHVDLAELRERESLFIDLGTAGAAKYTLGGWLAGNTENRDVEGTSTLLVRSPTAKFHLPAASRAGSTIAVRVKSGRAGRLHTYVNGRELGAPALTGAEFQTVEVAIPEGSLRAGENVIQFRVDGTQTIAALGGRVGFMLDWLRLGAAGEGTASDEGAWRGGPDAASLSASRSMSFYAEIPAGARLLADVSGRARVRVTSDDAGIAAMDAVATGPIAHDLGAFAGKVVRIDFSADGDARIEHARIVTMDGRALANVRRPRNVVVYLIDTLRADRLQPINPRSRVTTPGLARFVREAATMLGAHTQENWTKPSVTTLLSSLLPWQHNATSTEAVVPEAITLLPEVLEGRGYHTGAFIANGYVSDRFGFKQGWTTYRNYIREGRNTPAQYVAADVLEWLDARPTDKPFFLYVHTIDPHVPYRPPQAFLSMYDAQSYAGPVDFRSDSELLEKIKMGQIRLNDRDKAHLQALYDGEITYHDVHFASILEGLERRGVADDTLVVVTADHGEEFWDHGSVGHGHSVWEELLHIPLFVRWPGVTAGLTPLSEAVGLVDIMPTVLDVLGHPIPDELSGRSFSELLRGGTSDRPRAAVSGFMDGWRTAVSGRYKVVQRGADRTQLYDLASDPGEERDVSATHPIALRFARAMLGVTIDGATSERFAQETTSPNARRPAAPRRPVVHEQQTTTIDAETEAQLRALGYVGSQRR
jgi:choline-sulfatase